MNLSTFPNISSVYISRKLPSKEFFEEYIPLLQVKAEAHGNSMDGHGFSTLNPGSNTMEWNSLSMTRLFTHDQTLHPIYHLSSSSISSVCPSWFPHTVAYRAYTRSQSYLSNWHQIEITGGDQLLWAMEMPVSTAKSSFKTGQQAEVVKQLKTNGYFAIRRDQELQREIRLRKKQFPGHPVFLLESEGITRYLNGIYGKSSIWHGAYRINLPTYTSKWGSKGDYELEDWQTAVVAKPQVRSNFSVKTYPYINRISRKWSTAILILHKYKLSVDTRLDIDKELIESAVDMSRFVGLE